MLQTVEAIIDQHGNVRLSEPVALSGMKRALVTILDDEDSANEAAILAESSLAAGWSGAKEDEAWEYLSDLPNLEKNKGEEKGVTSDS
jgi:hypothetical protein